MFSGGAISFFSLGVLLCDTSVVKSMHFPLQYRRDIRTHQGANAVLIVYATTNVLVAISENQGPNITLATKYVALFVAIEVVCRAWLSYIDLPAKKSCRNSICARNKECSFYPSRVSR